MIDPRLANPSLSEPPDTLEVEFDMHGICCTVRPRRARSWWVHVGLGLMAGTLTLLAIAALLAGFSGYLLYGLTQALLLGVAAVGGLGALLALAFFDSEWQREIYRVRLGEGWLVVRTVRQRGEVRVDLSRVRTCTVHGRSLVLTAADGEAYRLPADGHSEEARLWLATAVERAILEARLGDLPPPPALQSLLSPESRGGP